MTITEHPPYPLQAEALFGAVVNALPHHIAVLDSQGSIVYVNQAWKTFADANGLDQPGYGLGRNYIRILEDSAEKHPENKGISERLSQILAGEGSSLSLEYPCHGPESNRWFRVTFTCMNAQGKFWATASHENITQLFLSNQALKDREEKLKGMVASIPDPMCLLDRDFTIIWANDRAKETFGQDLVNKKCFTAYGRGPSACRDCVVADTFAHGGVHIKEYTHRDLGGSERQFRCRASVAGVDRQGRPARVMEIMQDITAEKQHEKEIQKLSRAVEHTPVSVVITDLEGTIEYVNPKFTQVTGYTSEEVIGKNPRLLSSGRSSFMDYKTLWDTISSGKVWTGEFVNRKKNGDLYWESAAIAPVYDIAGDMVSYVAVKEDITQQKNIMDQLKSAKEKAESATLAKSNFLATMSHEIRTPMNAILGMSRLVLDSSLDETQRRYLSNIHGSADALLSIIQDILDLTKIEADKMELVETQFQLGALVDKIYKVLRFTAGEKGIHLIYRHHHPLPLFLTGDGVRLSQILMNLTANALKYTQKGGVTVTTEFLDRGPDKGALEIRVADTGIGMSHEQVGQLFQPFTQLDGSSTRKYGGTGLGLVIAKGLAEMMSGRIEVSSRPGQGSEFRVTLPMKRSGRMDIPYLPVSRLETVLALVFGPESSRRSALVSNLSFMNIDTRLVPCPSQAASLAQTAGTPLFLFVDQAGLAELSEAEYAALGKLLDRKPSALFVLHSDRSQAARLCREKIPEPLSDIIFMEEPVPPMAFIKDLIRPLGMALPGEASESETPLSPLPDLKDRHMLVVDDDQVNREIVMAFLETAGATLYQAHDGPAALAWAESRAFDLILMDIQMPGMDGYETTEQLRQMTCHNAATVPVIALTGHAIEGVQEECGNAGMNAYLTKPVRRETLYATVSQWAGVDRPADGCLDTRTGLGYAGNTPALYRKMLSTFCKAYRDYDQTLSRHIAQGDRVAAGLLFHKLASAARMIGAVSLTDRAQALHRACQPGTERDFGQLKQMSALLSEDLTRVMAEAERFLAKNDDLFGPGEDPIPLPSEHAGDPVFTQLLSYVRRHRPVESRELIRQLLNRETCPELRQRVQNIDRLVSSYRFNEAEQLLGPSATEVKGQRV